MGGIRKRGRVPEHTREQSVLVFFLYQVFLLFKRGVFLKGDFQYFLQMQNWNRGSARPHLTTQNQE